MLLQKTIHPNLGASTRGIIHVLSHLPRVDYVQVCAIISDKCRVVRAKHDGDNHGSKERRQGSNTLCCADLLGTSSGNNILIL